ncbi:hypothetical protein GCM10018783_34860 [Streptomyces griseosporeus]|nr:hypothetical protein GCM10018783_34860 [Streptomyces griseosporeus]
MDREEHVCPVCGQPVETVVRRHKTLGAWVPVWAPGPCRNPGCAAYGTPAAEEHGRAGSAVGNKSAAPPGEPRAPEPAREDGGTGTSTGTGTGAGTSAGTGTDAAPAPGTAPAPGPENS